MAGDNPLVASRVDTTTPLSGAGILGDGEQLCKGIQDGSWVEGGLAAFSFAIDAVATASDPLGSLIAAGLGWLMDHLDPLKSWLDQLAGDAGQVNAFAQTWSNVAGQLGAAGQELSRIMSDVESLSGEAIDAYRAFQADAAKHLAAAGEWAGALAGGLSVAGVIVQAVHDLVRDVLSQLVGSIISWVAEEAFSLGLATPWVIEQVSTRVAELAEKVGTKLTSMLKSVKKLASLLEELKPLLSKAEALFAKVLHGGKGAENAAEDAARDASHVHAGDAATPKVDDRPYLDPSSRPSLRKGVPETVWQRAVDRSEDGVVRDPGTGDVINWTPGEPRKGVWDMGHLPGEKYSDMHARYVNGEVTPEEFRDWYNDPANYRPETPSSNRSHRYE